MTSHEAKFLMRLSGSCYEITFFASSVPFILAHTMAKPLSSLMQILSRPQHKEVALKSIGLAQICRPFVGFVQFCIGRLLITIFLIGIYEKKMPGFVRKPFTMYNLIAILMLSPLGLNFFLAYQEFAFFSFSSIYKTFAKRVLETSEAEPKLIRTIQPSATAEEKNIVVYDAPREILHGHLKELVDLMKNMTSTFGPFLFQNFSFMLLYWLLHSYTLCFFVLQTIRTTGFLTDPTYLALICVQFAGNLLIVR